MFLIFLLQFIHCTSKSPNADELYQSVFKSGSDWEPIRVTFDISGFDNSKTQILRETSDNIKNYLKTLLKVHPLKTLHVIGSSGFSEATYTDSDIHILFTALSESDEAAASTASYFDIRRYDYRPKLAKISVKPSMITEASGFDDNPRDLFEILIHEVVHALGVSDKFEYWYCPEANLSYLLAQRQDIQHTCKFPNIEKEYHFVSNKIIKEFIKEYYGDDDFGVQEDGTICPAGIELEDDGGDGSRLKHPEIRAFPLDIMSATHAKGKKHYFSPLTLALLNATGYYQVNKSAGERYLFGDPRTNYGKKMNKFTVYAPQTTWPSQYQCRKDPNSPFTKFNVCHPDLKAVALCDMIKYKCDDSGTGTRIQDICDNINLVDPERTGYAGTNHDADYVPYPEFVRWCSEPLDPSNPAEYLKYGSTTGNSSVCLSSSLTTDDSSTLMKVGHCYNIICDEKFTSFNVTLYDGATAVCSKKGQILTFPDSKFKFGEIECPDPYWTCLNNNNFVEPDGKGGDDDGDGSDDDDGKASSGGTKSNAAAIAVPIVLVIVIAAVVAGILIWKKPWASKNANAKDSVLSSNFDSSLV